HSRESRRPRRFLGRRVRREERPGGSESCGAELSEGGVVMAVRSPRLIVSVLGLIIVLGVLAVSCSKESPTSPMSAASTGKATISGTLVNATPEGQAGDPLPGVAVRAAGTRQSTQTDEAGRFTLSDLPAGQVELEFRGPGFQSSIAIHALAGQTTRVTVAL